MSLPTYAPDELVSAGATKITSLRGTNRDEATPVVCLTPEGTLLGIYGPEGNRIVIRVDGVGTLKLAAALAEADPRWPARLARWLLLRLAGGEC